MGITKLADLIRLDAHDAISHKDISDYTGKVIALDTSIVVNQFRAATPALSPLTGLFFRTLTFLEHGIKPVFVFDGKPPGEKAAVAPGDAEAMCAWLVRAGTVDAVASEDMDSLPFGANILIRQLNAKKDSEVIEYSLPKLLQKLQISHEEFVDLCILLGCDYCDKIAGLGPRRALTLIQKHRTIENVVLNVNRKTHPVPLFWKYKEARKLFLDAPQIETPELVWTEPDEEALVKFLCHVKYVKEERVRSRMEKFRKTREEREKEKAAGCTKQTKMEDFFRVTRKRGQPVEAADSLSSNTKRPKSK
ncbi:probable flap endonuclease 1 homolog isoform X2 [Seriola lalandi dorsalis]|uniref:probable flap endonuclease 1 homolog isoform X2 n=1 Tax=Seriola lalandi dorsalis TaxID=1841481 RepID=UPI000C6F9AFA|nr:probable flap endonuclease 1 homolog isoform X2 [Seriola lalandi dorsalis]